MVNRGRPNGKSECSKTIIIVLGTQTNQAPERQVYSQIGEFQVFGPGELTWNDPPPSFRFPCIRPVSPPPWHRPVPMSRCVPMTRSGTRRSGRRTSTLPAAMTTRPRSPRSTGPSRRWRRAAPPTGSSTWLCRRPYSSRSPQTSRPSAWARSECTGRESIRSDEGHDGFIGSPLYVCTGACSCYGTH